MAAKRDNKEMFKNLKYYLILLDFLIYVISDVIFLVFHLSNPVGISNEQLLYQFLMGGLSLFAFRIFVGVYRQDWRHGYLEPYIRLTIADILGGIAYIIFARTLGTRDILFITLFAIIVFNFVGALLLRIGILYIYQRTQKKDMVLLSSPTMHGEEQKFIQEAFDRNWVAPLGFNCDGFENEMVDYLKTDNGTRGRNLHALATVSGTSAIHLAVKLAGVKPGDIVLCSDMTFSATVNPVVYEGGKTVFVDSEPETWNMDPEALKKAFEKYPEAKFVDLVHLYGTPAKMDEIKAICDEHGATLIEDAAEALGADYKGQKCGSFGKYGILSFNGNKIITTSGGGMLLADTKESRDKALFWATQSRDAAPWYQHTELGYNYRMSNVVAGIGRGQLKYLSDHKERKTVIYNHYKEGLADLPVKMNPYLDGTTPNFWLSCMTIDPEYMCECSRTDNAPSWKHEDGKTCPDELAKILRDEGIETRPIWKPMHMQPFYKDCDFISTGVDEDIFRRGICLPSDIKMSASEQDRIIEIIHRAFDR